MIDMIMNKAMRAAHRWEPYPLYRPKGRGERVRWFFVQARWFFVSRFVKRKSFLNGRLLL